MEDMTCKEDLFCGINMASSKNSSDMNDLEKKHTPVIDAPAAVKKGEMFDVTVEAGHYMAHPNENAHFIEWIELYSGDTFLARADLVPRLTAAKVTFRIALDHAHELVARLRCNLHGLWQSAPYQINID
jgi:superoxide reductase